MQLLREKIEIEPGDAAATGEDEGMATRKGSGREKRWDEDEDEPSRTPQNVSVWWREH
ncbi:hypothetical protein C1H46_030863 [Malus baccata]|uniref:Uncharacterized protein n=1 Tax=Malus baccata TaxID=106549 RepID=A0A540LAN4_MALBA|nr:hypothetical protein C1H46_030863 [Malus baccata]